MTVVDCVIHRENFVAKNVAPKLHEVLYSVIKCINSTYWGGNSTLV